MSAVAAVAEPPVDVVVVGAGAAGLTAALRLAPRRVVVMTKARLGAGCASAWAQGGVAVAAGADDSPVLHAEDTMVAGAGLADPAAVRCLTEEGPAALRRLVQWGARFDRDSGGALALGREAAHRRARVAHAGGDATGAEMIRALVEEARRAAHLKVLEEVLAEDLVLSGDRVTGVAGRRADGRPVVVEAPAVVLATGGVGQLYRYTTNPPEATADGLAMAARAGALLADLEFLQFHPTALDADLDPLPLLTEALRGEGALLVDEEGHRFMLQEHPLGELAPRDVVARALWHRMVRGGSVYLDGRRSIGEAFPRRFPTVFAACRQAGLDPRRDLVPVAPAAHYHMGGVAVDAWGSASLRGLWACGEVASTGVHGANRLASNSLLEALVFGARVAGSVSRALRRDRTRVRCRSFPGSRRAAANDRRPLRRHLRELMWERVGLVRSQEGLEEAVGELERMRGDCLTAGGEEENLWTVAWGVASMALLRQESRGAHFREDFPEPDPGKARRSIATWQQLEQQLEGRKRASSGSLARAVGGLR